MNQLTWLVRGALITVALCCTACGGNSSGGSVQTRSFLMGSTPFFTRHDGSQVIFPDWRFENLDDRDLISLHIDDFLGVPWDYCDSASCANLPQVWVGQLQQLVNDAKATGKRLYLAVSPLGDRRTLAPNLLADGSTQAGWNSNLDGNGCYQFASDPDAAGHKASYITYLKYLIDLVNPDFFSPAIEMNMPFTLCPGQKSAWIAWYSDVHAAIKAAYPRLVVFPTFQLSYMYGIADAASACSSGTLTACFDARLSEALTIPADRIAISAYPAGWVYQAEFDHTFPHDFLARIAQATTRPIWISETGWPAVPVLSTYRHGTNGSCGTPLFPAQLDVPGAGTIDLANDTAHAAYLTWLLNEAEQQGVEAVVWWLNRDYLDSAVTGNQACPCVPTGNSTCLLLDTMYDATGDSGEALFRMFGNMALRYYDGSPRPGEAIWHAYVTRSYQP